MDVSSNQAETAFPVQKQLEAYNARDIDAFMQWWADDCQYYEFPSRLLASGAAEVRERHIARFKEPNLHGTLVKRIAVANVVVDEETVTRTFPDGPGEVDVVAIYAVENGKIAKAWFKMGPPRLHPVTENQGAQPSDAPAAGELTSAADAQQVPATVRAATPSDLPGLLTLYQHLRPDDPAPSADAASAAWTDMLDMPGLTVFVAALAGPPPALVATCTLFVLPNLTHGARPHAMIENVVTLATHRRLGLGRVVLDAAVAAAFAAGCYKVVLTTGSRQEETLRFYERAGFERGTRTAFQVRRP